MTQWKERVIMEKEEEGEEEISWKVEKKEEEEK